MHKAKAVFIAVTFSVVGAAAAVSYYRIADMYEEYRQCLISRKGESQAVSEIRRLAAEVSQKKIVR